MKQKQQSQEARLFFSPPPFSSGDLSPRRCVKPERTVTRLSGFALKLA